MKGVAWREWLAVLRGRREPWLPLAEWYPLLAAIPILQGLSAAESERLIALAERFLQSKRITCLGIQPTRRQLGWMALQACLPVLNLGLDWYRNFYELILLPDVVERQELIWQGDHTVGVATSSHLGEAWEQGPVVLVWPEVLHDGQWDGYHLLIHELAHKLDMLAGGNANGMPPERAGVPIARWQLALESGYQLFCEQRAAGEPLWLDEQAGEGPDEYFAILCEAFFSQPRLLSSKEPRLYQLLTRWFAQDPAARQPRASWTGGSIPHRLEP
jgi:MtfA peptidase